MCLSIPVDTAESDSMCHFPISNRNSVNWTARLLIYLIQLPLDCDLKSSSEEISRLKGCQAARSSEHELLLRLLILGPIFATISSDLRPKKYQPDRQTVSRTEGHEEINSDSTDLAAQTREIQTQISRRFNCGARFRQLLSMTISSISATPSPKSINRVHLGGFLLAPCSL